MLQINPFYNVTLPTATYLLQELLPLKMVCQNSLKVIDCLFRFIKSICLVTLGVRVFGYDPYKTL